MLEQYRAEYERKAQVLNGLVKAIAKELGGLVTAPADADSNAAFFSIPQGLDISVYWTGQARDKMRIALAGYPSYKTQEGYTKQVVPHDVLSYDERNTDTGPTYSISCSATREPAAIARDISRRLLPGATEMLKRMEARVQKQNEYLDEQTQATIEMCKALGVERRERFPFEVNLPGVYARINVTSRKSIRFEAFSVDIDTAIKIAKLLQETEGRE